MIKYLYMEHGMILSVSGWRKVFALSGDEQDKTPEIGDNNKAIVGLSADTFSRYLKAHTNKSHPVIVVGTDSRPTCVQIVDMMLRVFCANKIPIKYIGVSAAPEIMAFAKSADGFVYITASHNPIGHNGIKFGLKDGGVIPSVEAKKLIDDFEYSCRQKDAYEYAMNLAASCNKEELDWIYAEKASNKQAAVCAYRDFLKIVISGTSNVALQTQIFAILRKNIKRQNISVINDMNGSARIVCIDARFFHEFEAGYYPINNKLGEIVHEIIPEPENMVFCANNMDTLHKSGHKDVLIGYMPDCDGDRGNIVYWNEKKQKSCILKAQEVFCLSVLSELSYSIYLENLKEQEAKGDEKALVARNKRPLAVAVNCPTSMRIDEVAAAFGAKVFRAEVGEANVVGLAKDLREQGFDARILGEGSNGGTIIHPSSVRDPLTTVFAILKLLTIRDSMLGKGLFHLWLEATNRLELYKNDFSLTDIIATLPVYTTTGVTDARAVLKMRAVDHTALKQKFQHIFQKQWDLQKDALKSDYGIYSWKANATNGTRETKDISDFGVSGRGGLKVIFYNNANAPVAFFWMRGSGTEPVFRVLCDVKGNNLELENKLLAWGKQMLEEANR